MPSTKHQNLLKFLEIINYTISSTEETIKTTGDIHFICDAMYVKITNIEYIDNVDYKHTFTIKATTFNNKRSFYNKNFRLSIENGEQPKTFCAECNVLIHKFLVDEKYKNICTDIGYKFISRNDNRQIKYECSCGNISETDESGIAKIVKSGVNGKCHKCNNVSRRNNVDKLKEIFSNENCQLITTQEDYISNKQLKYICSCGSETVHTISLSDFVNRNSRCLECAMTRREQTNLKLYGKKNVFQNEYIKALSRRTCLIKYGFEFPMKNKICVRKAQETNMLLYGYAYAFNQPFVYEKIRIYNIEKFGVEYPFQSPEEFKRRMVLGGKTKSYILNNIEVQIMGNEDIFIDYLIGKRESDLFIIQIEEPKNIKVDDIPVISYEMNGIQKTYLADVMVMDGETIKKIIEVKSVHFYNEQLNMNVAKFLSASTVCDFECWVVDSMKETIIAFIFVENDIFYIQNKDGLVEYNKCCLDEYGCQTIIKQQHSVYA
jgi:hypothetical protein